MDEKTVTLSVPAEADFARSVRMMASTLAVCCDMSVEDVEDVRMIAEEGFVYSCATAPERVGVSFSLTGDGAVGWSHYPPEGFKAGKFDGACSVTRRGNLTEYSFTIPPERLGFELKDGTQFRIALLINDSDGGIRSRTMLFFDGLDGHKDTGKFGLVQLRSGRRK